MYDRHSWEKLGQRIEVDGHRIFYIDVGTSDDVIIVLHGFPTSSFDFKDALKTLSQNYRVIIPDHIGLGFSDKPTDYNYSLVDQAQKVLGLCKELDVDRVHIIAHDYGTSILTEFLALNQSGELPIELRRIILCNGSMLIHMSRLRPIQKLLRLPFVGPIAGRLATKALFRRNMKKIVGRPGAISESELSEMWEMIVLNGGKRVMSKISRYTYERIRLYARWIGALKKTQAEILILWGIRDPVAVPGMTDELMRIIPQSAFRPLSELGHYPMLEDADAWCREVIFFLKRI